jgi:hypothetical protein
MRYKLLSCDSTTCHNPDLHDGRLPTATEAHEFVGPSIQLPTAPMWDWASLVSPAGSQGQSLVGAPSHGHSIASTVVSNRQSETPMECPWRGRVRWCEDSGFAVVEESARHLSDVKSPKRNKLARDLRAKAITLAAKDMKPARIRNKLIEDLKLAEDEIPVLSAVQNCVQYHRRAHMATTTT